jgi:c-di-GMP-binding flagellar brake protein YcgR
MPWNEKRQHARVKVKIPALIRAKNRQKAYVAEVLNISEGGALISCETPIVTIGEELEILINFGDGNMIQSGKVTGSDDTEVEIADTDECVIRWATGKSGRFGIKFINLKEEKRQFLANLVRAVLEDGRGEED